MTGDSSTLEAGSTSSGPVPDTNSTGDVAMSPIVNLQVISPSSGVSSPLSFQFLPATTTVKEIKEKIRDALDVSPSPEIQRLIYRGRMLARDTATMMEVFGEEALKTSEQQTLHLVLRPPVPESTHTPIHTSNPLPNPLVDRIHAQPQIPGVSLSNGTPRPGEQGNTQPSVQPLAPGARRNDRPQNINPYYQPLQALQTHNDLQHRIMLQRLQMQHEQLTEQLNNFLTQDQRLRATDNPPTGNRLPMATGTQYNALGNGPYGQQHPTATMGGQQFPLPAFQNLLPQQQQHMLAQLQQQNQTLLQLQQQQQARAHGVQMGSDMQAGLPVQNSAPQTAAQSSQQGHPNRVQSSALPPGHTPDHTTTITRHGVSSNGDRWQITVNESTTVIPPGNNYQPPHVPTAHGNTETAHLQHLLQNAERLAMSARINNFAPRPGGTPPPGFNAPQRPSSTPPIGRIPRPTTLSNNSFPITSRLPSAGASFAPQTNESPMVYLMSSPNGPHALLVHNSQTFYSGNPNIVNQLNGSPLPGLMGEPRNRRERTHRHRHRNRDANAPAVVDGVGAAPQIPVQQAQNVRQPAQPQRGGGAIWPHVWLLIRLLIFIWFFTSGGDSSWSRLFVIWGIAVFLFIVNTGVFNDVFGAFWNPIRQHLENLLPLAGPNPLVAAQGRGAQAEGNAAAPNPHGEPTPEETARRLLEQRRQEDASWLMTQFRRVEHAVLLFVASIVPGTAERHIEARTIEENRILEQRRQEEAAAAAALEPDPVENQEAEAGADVSTEAEVVNGNEEGNIAIPPELEQVAVPV